MDTTPVPNSTPLPEKFLKNAEQKNSILHSLLAQKTYVIGFSVLTGFFIFSFVAYKMTEFKPQNSSAAPMVIKQTTPPAKKTSPQPKKITPSESASSESQLNEEEVESIDVGTVDQDLQGIQQDVQQL